MQADRYGAFNIANVMAIQQRERILAQMLRRKGLSSLGGLEILDVGCGSGTLFLRLMLWGAQPRMLHGIDIEAGRVSLARAVHPDVDAQEGNASALPWDEALFDIVTQFTTFTSILSSEIRIMAAREIDRVLKPGGILIWYDFWLNPTNPQTHPIPATEIRDLFPGYNHDLRRVTLAPPIARAIAPLSCFTASLLQEVWFLQSHLVVVITKPAKKYSSAPPATSDDAGDAG